MNERRVLCVLAVWCRGGLEGCLASRCSMLMAASGRRWWPPVVVVPPTKPMKRPTSPTQWCRRIWRTRRYGRGTDVGCAGSTPILDVAGAASGYVGCPDSAILRVDSHVWTEWRMRRDADCGAGEVCIGTDIGAVVGGVTGASRPTRDQRTVTRASVEPLYMTTAATPPSAGCAPTTTVPVGVGCPPEANQCAVPTGVTRPGCARALNVPSVALLFRTSKPAARWRHRSRLTVARRIQSRAWMPRLALCSPPGGHAWHRWSMRAWRVSPASHSS